MIDCYIIIKSLPPCKGKEDGVVAALVYGFGINHCSSQKIYNQYLQNKCSTEKKSEVTRDRH